MYYLTFRCLVAADKTLPGALAFYKDLIQNDIIKNEQAFLSLDFPVEYDGELDVIKSVHNGELPIKPVFILGPDGHCDDHGRPVGDAEIYAALHNKAPSPRPEFYS